MSHHHDQDHHHNHDHHHGHAHSHTQMTFPEKLVKLLDHWIDHNDHHAADYRKWAQEATDNGFKEVGELLESAAELTGTISDRFREAGKKTENLS